MDVVARLDELGVDILAPGFSTAMNTFLKEYKESVISELGIKTEFAETLPNDGEFEYTQNSDCDGSNQTFFRRLPKKVAEPTAWEKTTAEEFYKARYIEE